MLAYIPGPIEIGVIALVGVVIFGRQLPKIARGMGSSIVEFKKGLKHGMPDELADTAKALEEEVKK